MLVLFTFSMARGLEPDLDGDGWTAGVDCDDLDASVNPDADEACDEIDDDCDGLVDDDDTDVVGGHNFWVDADGDGVGHGSSVPFCTPPAGYARSSGDCDDADPTAARWAYSYVDGDGDGYGYGTALFDCGIPSGHAARSGDCGDHDASIHPDATEVCNGIDDNCDHRVDEDDPLLVGTVFYDDSDRDGYGDDLTTHATRCTAPRGYVEVGGDCDVTDVSTHPGAAELCDGKDNDCDGAVDETVVNVDWYTDADGDGYGEPSDIQRACSEPPGYARARGDCDDADATVFPGRSETCGNGVDDNCDGAKDNCSVAADDVADLVIQGGDESWFGAALAVGDIDGDGVADLWVGAPLYPEAVFAFSGPASGSTSIVDAAQTLTLTPSALTSGFASAVFSGDANGDGYADLLVGAPDGAVSTAFLFLGPTSDGTTDADADGTYTNDGYGTSLGADVDVMGDHDGDGVPDVAIGSPGEDFKRGKVCVVSGALTGGRDLSVDSTYRYTAADLDRAGQSLATLDENADGIDDLLFGAPYGAAAYVVDGGAAPGSYAVPEAATATFLGNRPRPDNFGWDVAAGDLDGDGHDDAIVSAPMARTSRGTTGVVYAFLGPLSGTAHGRAADVRWEGGVAGAFGWSIATGGDVDGDGEIDTLIGAPNQHDARDVGTVYLQLGTPRGVISSEQLAAFGTSEPSWLGTAVAFVPDWDGDGFPEIAAGAPVAADDSGAETGQVSVIFSDSLFE